MVDALILSSPRKSLFEEHSYTADILTKRPAGKNKKTGFSF